MTSPADSPSSELEDRLVREVASYCRDVVVTDEEVEQARVELHERLGRRQDHRSRTVRVLVAAVAVPLLVVAGIEALRDAREDPGPAAPGTSEERPAFLVGRTPTRDLLEGVWRLDNSTLLMQLDADGDARFDHDGELWSRPDSVGRWTLAGDEVTVAVDAGSEVCAGATWSMRTSIPSSGALRAVHTAPEGSCPEPMGHSWVMEQVLPSGPALTGFTAPTRDRGWGPPPSPRTFPGDWIASGGGHVLELADDGSYVVAAGAGELVDSGSWLLGDGLRRLTLVSDGTRTCENGDRLVLDGVEHLNPGTAMLRAARRTDDCGGAWAGASWILLPDSQNRAR